MQSPDDEPHAESPSENGPLSAEESIDSFMEEGFAPSNSIHTSNEHQSGDEDEVEPTSSENEEDDEDENEQLPANQKEIDRIRDYLESLEEKGVRLPTESNRPVEWVEREEE
jgi:beta-phosphoglucomutase-like phosphatase (HAD superfamily)